MYKNLDIIFDKDFFEKIDPKGKMDDIELRYYMNLEYRKIMDYPKIKEFYYNFNPEFVRNFNIEYNKYHNLTKDEERYSAK